MLQYELKGFKQVYKLNQGHDKEIDRERVVPQWKQLDARKTIPGGPSISLFSLCIVHFSSCQSFSLFFFSNTSLSCYTIYPVKFSSTVLFAVNFPPISLRTSLSFSVFTTFRSFSLFHVFSFSDYFSHTLSLSEPPLHGETGERKDDVWQLLYFDLLSVRLILTQCVSYQRPVDCVRCVFIHYSRLGHFSQESDNNWCVDLDRGSILVAWNESIWSHLGLS